MNAFLLDLWADLRAKRLWPVAVLLAVALVAVPVLMLKPAADPEPAAPGTPSAAALKPPPTAVATIEEPASGSRLGTFRSHNPFASRADAPPTEASGSGGDSGSGSGSAAGGGSLASASGASSDLTAGGGASAPSSSGGSGGSTGTQLYTYTVDVKFGRTGRERTYDDVKRLRLLPNEDNPMLVFLGASVSGDEAVFLVDSDLSQAGEGVCKPSADTCSFLYLRTEDGQDEHDFADSAGREYHLQLLKIEQKKVSAKASSSRRRGVKAKRATARKSAREFLFRPFLLDGKRR